MLLDYYQKRQVTSTPSKATHSQVPQLLVSSVSEDSDRDDIPVQGVQPLETQEVDVLEASMHSMSIVEEEQFDSPDEEARNDLRNSTIDMDERWTKHSFCEDGDSSDEDYVPFLQIRPGGQDVIEQLQEISMHEAVIDVTLPTFPEDDVSDIPESNKVVSEDDIVGKNASIVYHENLKTPPSSNCL
ncbi:hypothetical protein R3I93_004506 [Phoxinus phoxinus]|uniref:Uncharacterized protein n=1 Tax=Phoxinus phoxinus TaxID=58324 RepID=A0AAN9DGH9_9TELE